MKPKLTPKQAKFAQVYVETSNASEAYRQAYNAENMKMESINVNACKLLGSTNVAQRVQQLYDESKKRHGFTIDQAVEEYDEARAIAKEEKQTASMISATKNKCDLFGLDAPKKVNIEGSFGDWLAGLGDEKAEV